MGWIIVLIIAPWVLAGLGVLVWLLFGDQIFEWFRRSMR